MSRTTRKNSRVGAVDLAAKAAVFRPGRKVTFLGDSITQGSGASGSSSHFVAMTVKTAGQGLISSDFVNAGVAGEKSAEILSRIATVIALGGEHIHLQAGTNDAGQSVTLATYQANVIAIKAACDAAGVPMSMGLVPPRTSAGGTTIRNLIRSYNIWLRLWAPRAGVALADTFGALVDVTTGYLTASLTADGTHPNDAGHLAMAAPVAAMLARVLPSQPWPVVSAGGGLIADPLMASNPGGFSAGANTTISLVAASGGDVPAGQWKRLTKTNGTGSTVFANAADIGLNTGFTAGDVLMICFYLRGSTAAAMNKVQILNQSLTVRNVLFEASPNVTPGPIMRTITVQPGDTTLYLAFVAAVPASGSVTIDVGALDVFNLTSLGLASQPV